MLSKKALDSERKAQQRQAEVDYLFQLLEQCSTQATREYFLKEILKKQRLIKQYIYDKKYYEHKEQSKTN